MQLAEFYGVLQQILLALGIGVSIFIATKIFGQRASPNSIKNMPYECGLPAEGPIHPRFSVKFYITAMLFILFDVEVVFLTPWALIYRDFLAHNIPILLPILFFLLVLVVGLLYELNKGALNWEKEA